MDPSCIGKKGAKAEAKARAKAQKLARAQAKARARAEKKARAQANRQGRPGLEAIPNIEHKCAEISQNPQMQRRMSPAAEAEAKAPPQTTAKTEARAEVTTAAQKTEIAGPVTAEAAEETSRTRRRSRQLVSETITTITRSDAAVAGETTSPAAAEGRPESKNGTILRLCAKDIMKQDILWCSSEDSVGLALEKMKQRDAGYIMIGRDRVLEGIVSKSDLAGAVSPYLRPKFAKWRQPLDDATLQIKIKWIMSRPVLTVKAETSLAAIMGNMCRSGIRCLPVTNKKGRVQGLITANDILEALLKLKSDPDTYVKVKAIPGSQSLQSDYRHNDLAATAQDKRQTQHLCHL